MQPILSHDLASDLSGYELSERQLSERQLSERHGLRSAAFVALQHGSESFGVVMAVAPEPGAFSSHDADVLSLLAHAAGAAMVTASARTDLAGERLRLSAASSLTGTGLWRWDAATDELHWSPEMFEITGIDPATTPTVDLWESRLHPEDRIDCDLVAHIGGDAEGRAEALRLRHADGGWRELVAWSRSVLDRGSGTVMSVFGATVDVTSQRLAECEVARMAARDGLTGLANRTVLDDLTRRAIAALPDPEAEPDAGSESGELDDMALGLSPVTALLLLDLDRFKLVNDTLGHTAGDAMLVEVAQRLTNALELSAVSDCAPTIARLGGDEFVVLLPWVAGTEAACDIARWLLEEVRLPISVDGTSGLVCTGSIGVAVAVHRGHSAGELFREADLAMYHAKAAGRDRLALFDDQLRAEAEARVWAERRLRTAIDRGRLVAVYQPIVSLADEQLTGVEALVRLVDEDGAMVLPEGFIDVAEDTGLIVDLDRWMLYQGVAKLERWRRIGVPDLHVQVNVSARTMSQPGFDHYVVDLLAAHDVPHGALKLELTETSVVPGGSAAQDAMERLAHAGVTTGVDDFGTGYSALSYLQDLPVGFIKVDRSFVERLDGSSRPSAVVRAVIELAHAHGYQVTAEGVETRQQADLLRAMGCDHAQGWLFGRPSVEQLPAGTSFESHRGLAAH